MVTYSWWSEKKRKYGARGRLAFVYAAYMAAITIPPTKVLETPVHKAIDIWETTSGIERIVKEATLPLGERGDAWNLAYATLAVFYATSRQYKRGLERLGNYQEVKRAIEKHTEL